MNDTDGILAQYIPLRIKNVALVYISDNEEAAIGGDIFEDFAIIDNLALYNSHFEWVIDSERRSDSYSKIYDGEPQVFCAERRHVPVLDKMLDNGMLRLPLISVCYGEESIMLHDVLLQDLAFDSRLGVVKTPATLIDSSLKPRAGYSALSFHKSMSPQRINERLVDVPIEQRPMIRMQLHNEYATALLIHRDLLARWEAMNISEVEYVLHEKALSLPTLLKEEFSQLSCCGDTFYSFKEYQDNINTDKVLVNAVAASDKASGDLELETLITKCDSAISEQLDEYFIGLGGYDDPYFIAFEVEGASEALISNIESEYENLSGVFLIDDNRGLISIDSEPDEIKQFAERLVAFAGQKHLAMKCAVFHHNCLGSARETYDKTLKLLTEIVDSDDVNENVKYNDFYADD